MTAQTGFTPTRLDAYLALHVRANPGTNRVELVRQLQFAIDAHRRGERCECGIAPVLNSVKSFKSRNPEVSLELCKLDLIAVMTGKTAFDDLIGSGKARVESDRDVLRKRYAVFDLKMKNNMNLVLPLQPRR